jgi:ketosteroid isomerase-like protein
MPDPLLTPATFWHRSTIIIEQRFSVASTQQIIDNHDRLGLKCSRANEAALPKIGPCAGLRTPNASTRVGEASAYHQNKGVHMRRVDSLAALLVLSLLLFSGCQPAAKETNVAPAPNTNSGKETVDKAAIETALLRIENDWPRVIKGKDAEAVRRVEADDAVFIYPDGGLGDKAQDVKDMESGALSADSIEMADLKVNVLSGDAAIVSGRTIVKNGKYKTPDGKSIDISGQYRFVDTFARRNGEWKLVSGASVTIRQPVPATTASPATKASPAGSPVSGASPVKNASPVSKP